MKIAMRPVVGAVFGCALVAALSGCAGPPRSSGHVEVYAPPPAYVEAGVMVPDGYVYYPGYQVYYSSSHRHYIYRSGRSWVTRPSPPRVSVDVLFASPSVRLGFSDSPAVHHATVVRQYPKHWRPPGERQDGRPGDRGRGRGSERDGGR